MCSLACTGSGLCLLLQLRVLFSEGLQLTWDKKRAGFGISLEVPVVLTSKPTILHHLCCIEPAQRTWMCFSALLLWTFLHLWLRSHQDLLVGNKGVHWYRKAKAVALIRNLPPPPGYIIYCKRTVRLSPLEADLLKCS